MSRLIKQISKKSGMVPGALVHVGEKKVERSRITVINYDESGYSEQEVEKVSECVELIGKRSVTWINIDGVHDVALVSEIGEALKIHPLVLEDIVNTGQRPKLDDFEDYIFFVMKMLYLENGHKDVIAEQLSLIVGKGFVVSFQEQPGDIFENVRDRIRTGKGKVRRTGPDYLAYALIDSVVDNYFIVLESIGEKIEGMEKNLIKRPEPNILQKIYGIKRDVIFLRKLVWPLREAVSALLRGDSSVVAPSTIIYLRDVYEHVIQGIDAIETSRDMVSGMLDIYLSSLSNRMNEVMKVLTIFAAIFIPLTFIAGIYGMNFKYMPELEWRWGYFGVLGFMLIVIITMVAYFKKKKWM